MEKYSKFRDEGTGIAPFLAPRPNSRDFNILQKVALWILSSVFTIFAYIGILSYTLLAKFVLPGPLARGYLFVFVFVPLRILYSTFFYEGERKASVRKQSVRRAKAGDVILSNFVSPLDPLVYEYFLSPTFVFPAGDEGFEIASLYETIQRALSAKPPSKKGVPLSSIVSKATDAGRVVILFVEGTTTNGRGLLTLKGLDARGIGEVQSGVFASAIRYSPTSVASPEPKSLWSYLWSTSNATWWHMASVKVSGEPLPKATLSRDQIAKAIASVGRLRILGDRLDVGAKQDYVAQRATSRAS